MKNVNLVPQWYQRQQRRKRNLRIHVGLMLAVGGLMLGARFVAQQRITSIDHTRDSLRQTLSSLPNPSRELQAKQADLKRLEDLRLARRELGNTIPMSAVIQQLQNDLTPGMALSNVLIDVRSEPIKGSGFVGDTKNPPRYHDVAHLTVVGLSPDNRQVDQFIDSASKNPLFSDITQDYTRTGGLHNYPVRKFEIQLAMDLEPLTAQTAEAPPGSASVAGADNPSPADSEAADHGQ